MKRQLKKIETTVFWPDTHVPYQDKNAVQTALNFVEDIKPDRIVILGDFVDFMPVAKWDKDPRHMQDIQSELDQTGQLLDQIRKVAGKRCQIYYLQGNHEYRLDRYLVRNAPELLYLTKGEQDVLSVPYLLDLAKRRIEYIPYNKSLRLYNYNLEHGDKVSAFSAYTAKKMLDARRVNTIIAHTHRMGSYYYTGADDTMTAFEMGCLIDRNSQAAHYTKFPNWQVGLGVGEYHEDEKFFQVTPILFDNARFIFNGKLYKP